MVNGILGYLKSMFHTVKKEDVVKTSEFIFSNLVNDVIPALDIVILDGEISAIKDSDILHNIAKLSNNIKSKDNKDFLIKLKSVMENIASNENKFTLLINSELSDNVTDNNSTPKDGAILRVLNDIGAMNKYILDLVYFVILDKDETMFPKLKMKQIRENIPTFIVTLDTYSKDFSKLIDNIKHISNVNINIIDGNNETLSSFINSASKNVVLPNTQGFINNPIYHIRMWLVDREITKYESLKDQRRLIELRLMELKLKNNGSNDPKLAKQVEYYENKISKIEYEISEIEKI